LSEKPDVTPLHLAEIAAPRGEGPTKNLALLQKPETRPVVRSFDQQAAEVLRQAREQGAQIEKEAYERGYAQGEKDGQRMGEKRFELTARNLTNLLGELAGLRRALIQAAADELVQLALGLAQAIIRAEVSCGPEVALRAAKEALTAMAPEASVLIRLNPYELDYLKERGLLPPEGRFEADPRLTAGGCVAESERERFDASLERQLSTLEAALREEVARCAEATGPDSG
jgi:flagellar assembly protein FliH